MFETIFASADATLDAVFSTPFVYRIGTTEIPLLHGIVSSYEVEANQDHNIYESWIGHAFEFNVSELTMGGSPVVPEKGHEILEATGDGTQVYRVLPLPDSRCYAPADTENLKVIVYAKAIRKE
jgi:hypothetical protein